MLDTQDTQMSANDEALSAFHDSQLRHILSMPDDASRGEAATRYITWLDSCRGEATAIRDVAVYKLHNESRLGAMRIGAHLGVGKARGQQLIYRSAESYPAAAQALAKIRRRLGRGSS